MELESSAGQLLLLYAVELQLSAVCRGAEVVCLFFVPCLRSDSFFYAFVLVVLLVFLLFCFTALLYFQAMDASAVVMAVGMTPVPAPAVVTVPGRDFLAPLALALWCFHGFR